MENWGGENIEQSLRTWLCGGEIVAVPEAQVAHMWRTPNDARTNAQYKVSAQHALLNRARAAQGWFGNFSQKLLHYPHMKWIPFEQLNLTAYQLVRERMQCRPFAWFLWRFRHVYEDAGLLPQTTFLIRHVTSKKCLTYLGPAGTHPDGSDKLTLSQCGDRKHAEWHRAPFDPQRWHFGNQVLKTGRCCSGLRVWNTDQCLMFAPEPRTYICALSGRHPHQVVETESGEKLELRHGQLSNPSGWCIVKRGRGVVMDKCASDASGKRGGKSVWELIEAELPLETELYTMAKTRDAQVVS